MADTGMIRKTDELGRVTIPSEIRNSWRIVHGTPIQIGVEGDLITLEVVRVACVFCKNQEGPFKPFRGRVVCEDCLKDLIESSL